VNSGKISGDGKYTHLVHEWFERVYSFPKVLLTTSCTDALEMSAILLDIKAGDEIIIPSFTFVSTANAFVLRGATVRFADSEAGHPNVDVREVEALISDRTKAIVVVHYAGVACDMDAIMAVAAKHNIAVVEDAAQGINASYKGVALGSIGRFGTISFHETKNIICGEGGLLIVNDQSDFERAEVIREKGTNRAAYFRGQINKYGWMDIGSSFLPTDIVVAFLYAQLKSKDKIQERRSTLWERYDAHLRPLAKTGRFEVPLIPTYAHHNAHMYYLVCRSLSYRTRLIDLLKTYGVYAAFHYQSLHKSEFFSAKHDGRVLKHADRYSDTLVRLPLFHDLTESQVDHICELISAFD
jgi:dTDP-4-amino-4,6-dideoxygalactose transaminase